jgi:hydrogenase nickel incorporation protein HypA/HybF
MHELAIAEAVLAIAARHAEGRRVTRIELTVGALRQVVPSALEFSFEIAAQGTAAEGAALAIETTPARGRCRACATESDQHAFPMTCPRCGGLAIEPCGGDELVVAALECDNEMAEV